MADAALEFGKLTVEERKELALRLLDELIVDARKRLHFWRSLTHRPTQVDSGYISQHLVSLIAHIEGGGFRGKGKDLSDGSEIKSANFLDSEDAKGSVRASLEFYGQARVRNARILEMQVDLSRLNQQTGGWRPDSGMADVSKDT